MFGMSGSGIHERQMATQAKQSRTQDCGQCQKYNIALAKVWEWSLFLIHLLLLAAIHRKHGVA
jgi:hypothetical protein